MIDITISVSEKEYPFFMELVKKFDFVTLKNQHKKPRSGKTAETAENKDCLPLEILSPSMEGPPMSQAEFENWIHQAEDAKTVTLKQAKNKWAGKRKQLKQLIK